MTTGLLPGEQPTAMTPLKLLFSQQTVCSLLIIDHNYARLKRRDTYHVKLPIASGEQLSPTGTLVGTTIPNDSERICESALSNVPTELPEKCIRFEKEKKRKRKLTALNRSGVTSFVDRWRLGPSSNFFETISLQGRSLRDEKFTCLPQALTGVLGLAEGDPWPDALRSSQKASP